MNIFWLDSNLEKCAQYHCDKHIVKMPIEYAQLLSTTMIHHGLEAPYRETHKNHPCAVWARKHKGNYQLLWDLADAVGREYTHRYGKVHKSHQLLLDGTIPRDIESWDEVPTRTPLPNCTTLKDVPATVNLCDIYRMYYIRDKIDILTWKNREEPPFMGDRFYAQQLKALGDCPGNKATVKKSSKPRITKADLAAQFSINGIEKLTVVDLQKLQLFQFNSLGVTMPEGRLKQPYIDCVKKHVNSDIDWSKLTVATLKEVIKLIC